MCGDNRFEIIAKAKKDLIGSTNIESRPEEMAVLDSFLFRAWQMGWLRGYEVEPRGTETLEKVAKAYGESEYRKAVHFRDGGMDRNKPEVLESDFVKSFIAGAFWMRRWMILGYEVDGTTFIPLNVHEEAKEREYYRGFETCRRQMLCKALEAEIMTNGIYPYEPRVVAPYPGCPYEFGEKVKVIIVEKDDDRVL